MAVLQPVHLKKIQNQKWQNDLRKNGYARIKKVFSTDEVNRMRAEALMCLTRIPGTDPQKLQTREYEGQEWPALLFWPREISSYLDEVRRDPRLSEIARQVLGDDIVQLNNQIYYRLPGDGDEFAWHQDITFRQPKEHYNQIETGYLQTIVVVDPLWENGSIEFIPGSHKWGDKNMIPRDGTEKGLRKFVRGEYEGERVIANDGDVLVWSVMVVHGSEKNRTNRGRMTYMNGFAKASSVSPEAGFPTYMKNGKVL